MIETYYVVLTFSQTCNLITCNNASNSDFCINIGLIYKRIIIV